MTEYTLVRSKRKTIALYIKDGKLSVKAPLKVSVTQIEAFISEKQKWIERKINANIERKTSYGDVLSYDKFLYLGERIKPLKCKEKSFKIADGTLFIPEKYYGADGELTHDDNFQKSLKRYYKKIALSFLRNKMNQTALSADLKFSSFSLTNAKTKWGSCDVDNNVRLNWRLILLPMQLVDYVSVHELAHTVRHDHSREFWALVSMLYPEYKVAIKCLKEVGILTEYLR